MLVTRLRTKELHICEDAEDLFVEMQAKKKERGYSEDGLWATLSTCLSDHPYPILIELWLTNFEAQDRAAQASDAIFNGGSYFILTSCGGPGDPILRVSTKFWERLPFLDSKGATMDKLL